MSLSHPRIAIIGAGPGGLTTGLLLHNHDIPFTIFDLRQKPTEEEFAKPSGMLDLHDESGIAALRECGLYDQFLALTGECAEAQKVADKDGNIIYEDEGELSERPEISRHNLTKLLISHLPSERIQWGHKLLTATTVRSASGQTEVELDFGNHGKQTFDLVIGADGAWSKIRNLVTDVKPKYAGVQNVTLTVREITRKYPHLAQLVGRGSFSALAMRHGIMSQRGPQDSARIYIFLTTSDEDFANTTGMDGKPATFAKEKLLSNPALLGAWGPLMKELASTACDEEAADNGEDGIVDIRGMYNLPIAGGWSHHPAATLIGDAAHLMCPWAGEGVNLAMWDSLLLARAIIKAHSMTTEKSGQALQKALEPLIKEFEVDMWARAGEKAEETQQNGEMLFCDDGAEAFKAFFLTAYGGVADVAVPKPE